MCVADRAEQNQKGMVVMMMMLVRARTHTNGYAVGFTREVFWSTCDEVDFPGDRGRKWEELL